MTVAPDMLSEFGGAPVGSRQTFEGWWGATTWFVDFDNGLASSPGDSMIEPTKNLGTALSNASAGDTIYIRPRDFSSEDPQAITPSTTEAANWTVATAKHDLSIIGTGKGLGHAAAHKTFLAGYGSLTTAIITINAPGAVIENLRSQAGTSTNGIFYSINDGTYDGGNTTFVNNDLHDAGTAGALHTCSCWQMSYVGNRFVNCDVGIYSTSSYSVPQIVQVWDNKFVASTSEVQNDIYFAGSGVKRFLAYHNFHGHGIPALGGTNVYIKLNATSTGGVHDSYFGAMDTAVANIMTLNGVIQSGNHSSEGLITTT